MLSCLWGWSGAVTVGAGIPEGRQWGEVVVFNTSTLTTLATSRFAPGTRQVNLAQARQAVFTVFALGYLLWISQRSYED